MTKQFHLYDDCTPTVRARQLELFTTTETELRCATCGRFLVETESGYLCCPRGCGKLIPESDPDGRWLGEGLLAEGKDCKLLRYLLSQAARSDATNRHEISKFSLSRREMALAGRGLACSL